MSEDETLIEFRGVKIVPEEAKLIEEIEKDMGVKLDINTLWRNDFANFVVDKGHVVRIRLWDKKFRQKNAHIFKFSKIKVIDLMNTKVPIIPPEVGNLFDLKELTLFESNINSIQSDFDKLSNLIKVVISEGNIDRVPLFPCQIEEINLDNLGLKDFPTELRPCKKLKHLSLVGNPIKIIPNWFHHTKNTLHKIYLHNTNIKVIPDWFSEFHLLEGMFFGETQIEKICDLSKMKNLARISFKGCNLTEFPLSLSNLTKLDTISIRATGFPKVPDIFGNKPNLKRLYLNGFDLNDFPKSIAKCKKMEYLNFDYCRLDDAEPDFTYIEHLKEISLVECNLKILNDAFLYEPREKLDIRFNQIEKMPEIWLDEAHKLIADKSTWKNSERPLDLSDDDYLIMLAAMKKILYFEEDKLWSQTLSNIMDQLDVEFDYENILFESDGETYPPEIMGLQHLPDGRAFIGMYAGGDWEYPVYLYIFRVGDEIYARTPHSSNTYNADTGRSYGHEEDQEKEGYEEYDEPYEMNAKLVLAEIKEEMDKVEKSLM